jgi:hypothetical protein
MRSMQRARAGRPRLVRNLDPTAQCDVRSIRLAIAADYSMPPQKYFAVRDGIKSRPARYGR